MREAASPLVSAAHAKQCTSTAHARGGPAGVSIRVPSARPDRSEKVMCSAVTVTSRTVPARPGCDTRRTVSSTHRDGPRVIRPLTDFLREEASAGILLVAAAVVALVWANSPWSASYSDLWDHVVTIGSRDRALSLTLREWVNDAAMTLFFFVVGLEIKRELT